MPNTRKKNPLNCWFGATYSNKSSFGPLNDVEFGPIDSLLVFHGDLKDDLLSDSLLMLSLVIGVAVSVVLFRE